MVFLHFAGREQGRDYGPLIRFLWDAFAPREESRTPPLMHDSFERQQWDRGAHLLYRGATGWGGLFRSFRASWPPGRRPGPARPGGAAHQRDAAWFGYGLDWSLERAPFKAMDRVSFTLQGSAAPAGLHNLTKIGSGSATLVLQGDYARQEKRRFVVEVETTGEVGDGHLQVVQGRGAHLGGRRPGQRATRQHPVALEDGLAVSWEGGAGTDLVAGDYWMFWGGEPAVHPRRLLVVLNDSSPADPDPWGPQHTYVHAVPDRFAELTAFEVPFSQFWRRDNLIDDGDRVQAMWGSLVRRQPAGRQRHHHRRPGRDRGSPGGHLLYPAADLLGPVALRHRVRGLGRHRPQPLQLHRPHQRQLSHQAGGFRGQLPHPAGQGEGRPGQLFLPGRDGPGQRLAAGDA